jgi:hypothetical protein
MAAEALLKRDPKAVFTSLSGGAFRGTALDIRDQS